MPALPAGLRGVAMHAKEGVVVVWQPGVTTNEAVNAWLDGGDDFEAEVLRAAGLNPAWWIVYDSELLSPTDDGCLRERLFYERRGLSTTDTPRKHPMSSTELRIFEKLAELVSTLQASEHANHKIAFDLNVSLALHTGGERWSYDAQDGPEAECRKAHAVKVLEGRLHVVPLVLRDLHLATEAYLKDSLWRVTQAGRLELPPATIAAFERLRKAHYWGLRGVIERYNAWVALTVGATTAAPSEALPMAATAGGTAPVSPGPELLARVARLYERRTGKNPRRAPARIEALALALLAWGFDELDDPPIGFHLTSHFCWPLRACRTECERMAVHLGTSTQGSAKRCLFVFPTRLPTPQALPCST